MNKQQIAHLQDIINGQCHSDSIIELAITQAENWGDFEAKVLLKSLKSGLSSFKMRMTLSRFVCDLSERLVMPYKR